VWCLGVSFQSKSQKAISYYLIVAIAALLLFCFHSVHSQASVSQDLFPVYQSMKANVSFWKKVYAEYPNTKGLIHDNRDLSIIYKVIDLMPEDQADASATNKARVDRAKEKYRHILQSLACGRAARTELNPALRPPVFEGRKYVPKGYKLRLPGKNGEIIKLASRLQDKAFADKQQRSRFYQFQRGIRPGPLPENMA
jgi:hypothetical protein